MTKQQIYIQALLAACCLAVPVWGQQPILAPKATKYKTAYDYIIDNFKGAVEYVHGGPSFRSEGIVIGYYLYQYYHQPLHSKKERKRIAAASKDASILEQPNTRSGEASFMIEGGMHLSTNRKWRERQLNCVWTAIHLFPRRFNQTTAAPLTRLLL